MSFEEEGGGSLTMDYNLRSLIPPGKKSTSQLIFKDEPGCILPINLSTSGISVLHSPHIQVSGKNYEKVGDWYLTGTLDSHARCGEFVRALGCEDFGKDDLKHDRIIETYSCHRPGCPECYESWAFRDAEKATERLLEGQQLYFNAGKKFSLKHVVFSPDPSDHRDIKHMIEQGRYNVFKAKAIEVIKKAGVIGGCITPHFWRQVGEKEELPDNVLIPVGLKEGDWYFSPHFHTIVAGFMIPSVKFHNDTGWVYKNLGKRKSVKDTIFYFLTHCANHKNHHAISWFGIFSYNKLVTDFIEFKNVTVPCSACNKPLHEYALDYSWSEMDTLEPDWEHDKGIHFRKVKFRHFKIRSPVLNADVLSALPTGNFYFDMSDMHEVLAYCNE